MYVSVLMLTPVNYVPPRFSLTPECFSSWMKTHNSPNISAMPSFAFQIRSQRRESALERLTRRERGTDWAGQPDRRPKSEQQKDNSPISCVKSCPVLERPDNVVVVGVVVSLSLSLSLSLHVCYWFLSLSGVHWLAAISAEKNIISHSLSATLPASH